MSKITKSEVKQIKGNLCHAGGKFVNCGNPHVEAAAKNTLDKLKKDYNMKGLVNMKVIKQENYQTTYSIEGLTPSPDSKVRGLMLDESTGKNVFLALSVEDTGNQYPTAPEGLMHIRHSVSYQTTNGDFSTIHGNSQYYNSKTGAYGSYPGAVE